MGGFTVVAISILIIWLLGKVIGEKPGDADKRDAWSHYKRKFRASRMYYLFAARTRERLLGELFVFYMVGGMLSLFALDVMVSNQGSVKRLDEMAVIEGKLNNVALSRRNCDHQLFIQTQNGLSKFYVCLNDAQQNRILSLIEKDVVVWVDDIGALFDQGRFNIEQLQYQHELVIDYAEIRTHRENAKRNGWKYFVLLPLLVAALCFWQIARLNIRKFGQWKSSSKEGNSP